MTHLLARADPRLALREALTHPGRFDVRATAVAHHAPCSVLTVMAEPPDPAGSE